MRNVDVKELGIEIGRWEKEIKLTALNSQFRDGQMIQVGFGLCDDYFLTYHKKDIKAALESFKTNLAMPEDKESIKNLQINSGLSEEEKRIIAAAWSAVWSFNGGITGETGDLKEIAKQRARVYTHTDFNRVATFEDFQGKGMMLCTEIAILTHAMLSELPDYRSHFIASGVLEIIEIELKDGHSFVILQSRDSNRYILIDFARHKVRKEEGGKKRFPFVHLLTEEQLNLFEKGERIFIDDGDLERGYRTGYPFNDTKYPISLH